jgi:hypothetical protein
MTLAPAGTIGDEEMSDPSLQDTNVPGPGGTRREASTPGPYLLAYWRVFR